MRPITRILAKNLCRIPFVRQCRSTAQIHEHGMTWRWALLGTATQRQVLHPRLVRIEDLHKGLLSKTCPCIQSSYSSQNRLLLGAGILALFGFGDKEDEDGKKVPPSIKRQLLKAQRALRNGPDYDEAERAYHKALEMLSVSKHAMSQVYQEARAVTLDKLANLYLEQEKFDLAEATFKEALRVMLTTGMEQNDDVVIEISLKLSKIYTNQKRYALAHTGFLWCVDTARSKCKDTESENSHALLGMCLHSEGQYHLVVGENKEAATAFSEALDIAKQVYGPKHIQVAVVYNDLATAVDMLGDGIQAEDLVRKSIEITESLEGVQVQEYLVIYYANLAMIQNHKGELDLAEESFKTALKLAKKLGNRDLIEHVARERTTSRTK